jgi:hypothetical protein
MSANQINCQLSGVVLNQNQPAADDAHVVGLGTGWLYQEFFLPGEYKRGADSTEQYIPALSGWQLLVDIYSGYAFTATIEWTFEYQVFGVGWIRLAEGTSIGSHMDGPEVWFDMYFDEPVEITEEIANSRLRFGFKAHTYGPDPTKLKVPATYDGHRVVVGNTAVDIVLASDTPYEYEYDGVPGFFYYDPSDKAVTWSAQMGVQIAYASIPNPLAQVGFSRLYFADGVTPWTYASEDASVNFRVLGLVADEGVDYLGNIYRSVVIPSDPRNVSAVDGDIDKAWLSKPNPSRFAVESQYFDVRKSSATTYGLRNMIPNPSFEIGYNNWVADPKVTLSTTGATSGIKAASWKGTPGTPGTFPGFYSDKMPCIGGRVYSAKFDLKAVTIPPGESCHASFTWYDSSDSYISDTDVVVGGVGTHSGTLTGAAPSNAAKVLFSVSVFDAGTHLTEMYLDSVCVIQGDLDRFAYFDGSMPGYFWTGAINASPSLQRIEGGVEDTLTVIDTVLVDPLTPGVFFTVYYSTEGDPGISEEDWENKLWTRVPKTFQALKRENHVLPQPILAKYIKIEYSHLQARSYNPGDFARPTKYKKHPKWVLDYFLARVNSQNDTLGTGRVGIIYDALDLAYNYYVDDLKQEPDQPLVNTGSNQAVSSFLQTRDDLSDKIDPAALDKISTIMQPYRSGPQSFSREQYLLGAYTLGTQGTNYPTERPPSTVPPEAIELRNEAVVFENDYPVMFFFITCRHKYREVVAPFAHNRAYFVGIKEVAFQRDRYTSTYDGDQYIEPAGDMLNVERSDLVMEDGVMVVK